MNFKEENLGNMVTGIESAHVAFLPTLVEMEQELKRLAQLPLQVPIEWLSPHVAICFHHLLSPPIANAVADYSRAFPFVASKTQGC